MNIITRFAPSPTGLLHAGSYRTALFSYIFAKKNNGKFILRIEDTDKIRSKKEFEDNIVDSLNWLGLKYDEFHRQSERTAIYKEYIKKLIASGHAYVSKEKPDETKPGENARTEVIRFKNPNRKVVFEDVIRGKIEFDTTELGDFVIAKSEDEPVFHLVVVIDDHEMGVTHIIRGEDHISNTPRQILIYEALGVKPPVYAHIPLLLAKDRSKLSKRNGALPISDYRTKGYLPSAIVNYMALLGWHPADDRELMTFDEIVTNFSLDRVQKGGAIFDEEKLTWFNRMYMQKLGDEELLALAKDFIPDWANGEILKRIVPLLREKANCFADIQALLSPAGELGFVHTIPDYTPSMLLWKKNPDISASQKHLSFSKNALGEIADSAWSVESIKNSVWKYAEEEGRGDVLWPLRVALTGQEKSPDPFVSAFILGKEEAMIRLEKAITKCSKA